MKDPDGCADGEGGAFWGDVVERRQCCQGKCFVGAVTQTAYVSLHPSPGQSLGPCCRDTWGSSKRYGDSPGSHGVRVLGPIGCSSVVAQVTGNHDVSAS